MKCPTCPDVELTITHRQDIEIDYCPKCRGVWLDRGELDKVIERSAAYSAEAPGYRRDDDDVDDDDRRRYPQQRYGQQPYPPQPYPPHPYPKKKKSFWSELFD